MPNFEKKMYTEPEVKKINVPEIIPETEGLVFKEQAHQLLDGFVSDKENAPSFLRPLLIGARAKNMTANLGNNPIDVKETLFMGKAGFRELPAELFKPFNFIAFKGAGENLASAQMFAKSKIEYPLGKDNCFPFFYLAAEGMMRPEGSAFYMDLKFEAENAEYFSKFGIRMPKILATNKFTREFCQNNDLPVPQNDDSGNTEGESMKEYIESRKDRIEPELYQKLTKSLEAKLYPSAILGENVRAFRNIWRVIVVEEVLKEKESAAKNKKLAVILNTSRKILGQEFNQEMNNEEYASKLAEILGQQAAILIKNKLIKGAMMNHKQDITLSGELCDYDTAYHLDDEYLTKNDIYSGWVFFKDKEKTKENPPDVVKKNKQEWLEQQQEILYRQIVLIGSHLMPIIEAIRELESKDLENSVIIPFVAGITDNLSAKELNEMKSFITANPDFAVIDKFADKTKKTLENLEGYQPFFDKIIKLLSKK